MLPAPYFRNRNIKTEYQPYSIVASLTHKKKNISFNVLDTTWLYVKISDCLLELLKELGVCLSF